MIAVLSHIRRAETRCLPLPNASLAALDSVATTDGPRLAELRPRASPTGRGPTAPRLARPARSGAPAGPGPVTVVHPSTTPAATRRLAVASKSAPVRWTAPFTGLARRCTPPFSVTGKAGSKQSPRSFRTRRPVVAVRLPSCTTRASTPIWPGITTDPMRP